MARGESATEIPISVADTKSSIVAAMKNGLARLRPDINHCRDCERAYETGQNAPSGHPLVIESRKGYITPMARGESSHSAAIARLTADDKRLYDERERCAAAASWAIHDCALPPGEKNLEIRSLINTAVLAAIKNLP